MNKAGLIAHLAQSSELKEKEVEKIVDNLLQTIINELVAGRKINLVGFGSFEAKLRHARGGINPQKPTERITIPEVRVAKFKTGKALKDALKGNFSPSEVAKAISAESAQTTNKPEPISEPVVEPTPTPVIEPAPVIEVAPVAEPTAEPTPTPTPTVEPLLTTEETKPIEDTNTITQ